MASFPAIVPIQKNIRTVTLPVDCAAPLIETNQSPAVRDMVVMSCEVTVVVIVTADPGATVDETYSPTDPAAAALFVVVPITPDVVLNVTEGSVAAPAERVELNAAVVPATGDDPYAKMFAGVML